MQSMPFTTEAAAEITMLAHRDLEVRIAGSDSFEDAELVDRLKNGDEEAFAGLLRKYQGKVSRLAMNMTRNRGDAEEVTQDVFLAVYKKIGGFNGRAAFSTWLYRIASNAALMKLRVRRSEPHLSIEEEGPAFTPDGLHAHPIVDWSDLPDKRLFGAEGRRILKEAISALPMDYRVVVVLRDVEGLSNQEVAEILGATVPLVKSRLHRARLVLRERLASYFEVGRESRPASAPGPGWTAC